jgi:uncharacterized protein (TIGR03032 family)
METPVDRPAQEPGGSVTEVRFEYTQNLPAILQSIGASLLISTYQAGKLVVVGSHEGAIDFAFHSYEQVMGIAASPRKIAVGARREIWFLNDAPEIARNVKPPGKYDACYLTRSAHVTGAIHGHELAWAGEELWVVNTLFSCLCTLNPDYSFVPRWKPPFIRSLSADDRCHLNGLAMDNGAPRYVTAMGEVDEPAGWRPTKATGGCVIDVAANRVIARGLAMPHSPRLYDGRLWVLDSGRGRLSVVDAHSGRHDAVAELRGYTRGLSFNSGLAFVGLSRIRETAVFGGLPIEERSDQLQCGVAVVDLRSGREIASLTFHSGVEEIFAVEAIAGTRCPVLSGPDPARDGAETIWLVPRPI